MLPTNGLDNQNLPFLTHASLAAQRQLISHQNDEKISQTTCHENLMQKEEQNIKSRRQTWIAMLTVCVLVVHLT